MAQGQAGEKTEQATQKKKEDARKEGQVLRSTETSTAICALIMFAFMSVTWVSYMEKMMGVFQAYLSRGIIEAASHDQLTTESLKGLYSDVMMSLLQIILPVFGVAILAGLIANLIQVGFLFTTKPLTPKLSRISPLQGFKRMFSSRTLAELLKSILKIVCLGYIFYTEYLKLMDSFAGYMGISVYLGIMDIMKTAFNIAIKMCMALAVIAAFDFLFQWQKHRKDLMMSKQEVKDEYKNTEGDPQIKNRIRQKQRQMSAMRLMESVPTADVVITNPTHYAVALRYDTAHDDAPVVVAKGVDFLARKIKEAAWEHGVEVVENRPLARALYDLCDIDQQIPSEFYQAVADVLVYVYKQKQRVGRAPNPPAPSSRQTVN